MGFRSVQNFHARVFELYLSLVFSKTIETILRVLLKYNYIRNEITKVIIDNAEYQLSLQHLVSIKVIYVHSKLTNNPTHNVYGL